MNIVFKYHDCFSSGFRQQKREKEVGEGILKHLDRLISIQPSFGKHDKIDHLSVSLAVHFLPPAGRKKVEYFIEIKKWQREMKLDVCMYIGTFLSRLKGLTAEKPAVLY